MRPIQKTKAARMVNGTNGIPPPPVVPPPLVAPRIDSLYNLITRRIRAANTIFGDRVKLDLRQRPDAHWSYLDKPYLLVIPMQTRTPKVDEDWDLLNPRIVMLVAQFDGKGSEGDYLAAIDIETAEKQLLYVLNKWYPLPHYQPTTYSGMKIQGTREPAVKVAYLFTFNEQWVSEPPIIDDSDALPEVTLEKILVHVGETPCCEPELPLGPTICVASGCRPINDQVDECKEPDCPPLLGDDDDDGAYP